MSPPPRRGRPGPRAARLGITTLDALQHAARVQHDLEEAACLPGLLAAGFEAFEAIRLLARGNENRDPGLFAAFMMAADAAVDGREALTVSPSLPLGSPPRPAAGPAPAAALDDIADAMTGLAAQLAHRLSRAAALAQLPGDRAACGQAADAARQIRALLARGDDDGTCFR